MSLRQAARLAYELPPGAAIYRGESLNERVLSEESFWLRALFNIWVDEKDRVKLPSELAEQMERREAQIRKAEAMHARQQGGVSRG